MLWLTANWFWVLVFIAFIWMHASGHGCHAGHGSRGSHAGRDNTSHDGDATPGRGSPE